MDRILTLEETQRRHKELWMWLAEETRRIEKKADKQDFFLTQDCEIPENFCWCCKFVNQSYINVKTKSCYILCPIKKWGGDAIYCVDKNSLYELWEEERDWQKAADLAEQIARLPFKKAFDITPEQAKTLRDKGYGEIYSTEEI